MKIQGTLTRACPQLEDSQAGYRVIHRRSADSELTDAPLRPSGRSMGQDQGYFARTGRACGGNGQGQSAVCRSGDLPLSGRHPLAVLARTLWRPNQDPYALLALGQERRVEEAV